MKQRYWSLMNKAKRYLLEIRTLKRTADVLEEQVEMLRIQASQIRGIRYDKTRVQSSASRGIDDIVIELRECEKKYEESIARYHAAVQTRTDQIMQLEKPEHVQVLLLRYVQGKHLDAIAEELHYSYQWVREMHGKALEEFRKRFLKQPTKTNI